MALTPETQQALHQLVTIHEARLEANEPNSRTDLENTITILSFATEDQAIRWLTSSAHLLKEAAVYQLLTGLPWKPRAKFTPDNPYTPVDKLPYSPK